MDYRPGYVGGPLDGCTDSRDVGHCVTWRVWPSPTDPGEKFILYQLCTDVETDLKHYEYVGEYPFGDPPELPSDRQQPTP